MTLIYAESFDDGHYTRRYTSDLGITLEAGIHGQAGRPRQIDKALSVSDRDPSFVFGCYYRPQGGLYTGPIVDLLGSGGVAHVSAGLTPTGELVVTAGAVERYRSDTNLFQVGVWRYIEISGVVNDTTGELAVRVDGTQVYSATGLDTRNGGADADIYTLRYGDNSSSRRGLWDDVYFANQLGAVGSVQDFIGPLEIDVIRPNGNGFYSALVGSDADSTDNYLNVDETTPSTADYNGSATPGDKDSYAMEDLAATAGTVHALVASAYAFKSDAGAISGRSFVRRGGTDSASADEILSESATLLDRILETDPIAGGAWTITNVNSTEMGWEVRA